MEQATTSTQNSFFYKYHSLLTAILSTSYFLMILENNLDVKKLGIYVYAITAIIIGVFIFIEVIKTKAKGYSKEFFINFSWALSVPAIFALIVYIIKFGFELNENTYPMIAIIVVSLLTLLFKDINNK